MRVSDYVTNMEGMDGLWDSIGVKYPLEMEAMTMTLPLGGIVCHLAPHSPVTPVFNTVQLYWI